MGSSISVGVNGVCRGWRERSISVSDTECFVIPLLWQLYTFATKETYTVLLNIMAVLAVVFCARTKLEPEAKPQT